MEPPPYDLIMQAIYDSNINSINCYLSKGVNINKICSNGMTLMGSAAQTGNLSIVKLLIDYYQSCSTMALDYCNENRCTKPQYLHLDVEESVPRKRYKNIGYFVVCRDVEENEFGDGPTPEGMEALEWDMEINDTQFSSEDETVDDGETNMYKWYASILNRTSILLESPERDMGRLDRHGQSVLHYAINSGNVDMVSYLILTFNKEISVNQPDACGFTPIHMAVANQDVEMVKFLLRKCANVNCAGGRQRQTPLHIAARTANLTIMRLLMEAGADINAVDTEEVSVLGVSVRHGSEEAVKMLVNANVRVNHEEPGGVTPLRLAVWSNNTQIVRILMNANARIVHSHHLLHSAVSNNNVDIVKILVECGSPLNVRDDQGHTPLMIACSRKNLCITKYLLANGADVNASSHIDGKTALHVCVQDVREARSVNLLVEVLVKYGADMNAISCQGSVLFYSIILENRYAAAALVRNGADVNLRDERAYVDNLSLAKRHGDLELVKLLVYAGFRLNEMQLEPRTMRTQQLDPACDFLITIKTNPLQLKELCRILIRRKIGTKNLVNSIYSLPLPTFIQRYLALEIL